jgi:hypothetical protein
MKPVKSVKDKNGEFIDLYKKDSLSGPALSLFLRVYAEIVDKGWANQNITWEPKNYIIWAQKNNHVVGGICYDYRIENKTSWIVLSFVEPEQRGKRIYEILHEFLEEETLALGGKNIASLVHVDNISRQKSAEKVGMRPQFYRMFKKIK